MSSFKGDFLNGVFYTSISKYMGIIVSLLITAVLARLLDPVDFGLIAVASIMINFVNLLTDFGLCPAIIQNNDLNNSDLQSLFSFTILSGIVAAIFVFCFSQPIALYYENVNLINIIELLSINIFLVTINIIPNALLLKNKQFKLIAIRTLLMQVVSGLIGILMAFAGCGIYSLVVQSLLSSLGIFVFNYIHTPIKPTIYIKSVSIKKVLNFSAFQFFSQIFNYFTKDIDKLLIGKYTSLSQLGYYEKSYRLMQLPVGNLSYVFTPVMQPVFKEYQYDHETMFAKYGVILKCLSLIAFPLSAYLFFESYDLISVVYGSRWEPAAEVFKYLALSIGCNVLLSSSGPMFLVTNNVRMSFINCIVEFIISISCIIIGLLYGDIKTVAIMVSVGALLRFVFIFFMLTKAAFKVSIVSFVANVYSGIFCGIGAFIIFYLLDSLYYDKFSITRLIVNSLILVTIILLALYKSGLPLNKYNKQHN